MSKQPRCRQSCVVPMRAEGSRPPLFLVHGVDGEVAAFRGLVSHLDPDQPVYAIRSQALLRPRIACTRVEELAQHYLADMQALRPNGPYHLLGYSFGGLVGFEIARQLYERGEQLGMIGMIDPRPMSAPGSPGASMARRGRWMRVAFHAKHVLGPDGLGYAFRGIRRRSLWTIYTILDRMRQPIPRFLQRAYDVNWFAAVRYSPQHVPIKLTIFQAPGNTSHERWRPLTDAVEVREISGTHASVLKEPDVTALAREVGECLASAQIRTSAHR